MSDFEKMLQVFALEHYAHLEHRHTPTAEIYTIRFGDHFIVVTYQRREDG